MRLPLWYIWARELTDLPATASALRAGDIGLDHARAISLAVQPLRPELTPAAVEGAETALVDAARVVDPDRIRSRAVELRHALRPDAVVREEVDRRAQRYLRVRPTFDGMLGVDGLLDPENGALLCTALDSLMRPDPSPAGSGPGGGGAPDDAAPRPRNAIQRRADALIDLCRLVLDGRATPTVHKQRPHATVVVDLDTLLARGGETGHEPGRLHWAGPISGDAVRRILCDARVTRAVVAGESAPLEMGRTTRTVPPWLWHTLVLRDAGCCFIGCDRPPEWTDAHHIVHWAHGGSTDLANLVLLCERHHHAVHEGGWRVVMGALGRPTFLPPERHPARPAA